MKETTTLNIPVVDAEKKRKTIFVLNAKGSNLSAEIRKLLDKFAKEFDEQFK